MFSSSPSEYSLKCHLEIKPLALGKGSAGGVGLGAGRGTFWHRRMQTVLRDGFVPVAVRQNLGTFPKHPAARGVQMAPGRRGPGAAGSSLPAGEHRRGTGMHPSCTKTPRPPQACEEEEHSTEQMHGNRSRFPPPITKSGARQLLARRSLEAGLWAAQTVDSRAARISPRSRCRSRAENPLGSKLSSSSRGASHVLWDGASPSMSCGTKKHPSERRRPAPGVSTWMRTPRFWGAPRQGPLLAWGARRDVNIVFPLINPIAAPCKCAQV